LSSALVIVGLLSANSSALTQRLIVVGGGAAGIFGAISACEHAAATGSKLSATVFESGNPLSKVLISGGGRCNVMHDERKSPRELSENYPRGSRELLGPLTSHFGAAEAAAWFRARGVKLKTEGDGRMFPTTDDSSTIANCLLEAAAKAGVEIVSRTKVVRVESAGEGGGFQVEVAPRSGGRLSGDQETKFSAECVLLSPGSSREVWDWCASMGHAIADPCPSLFTLTVAEASGGGWLSGLAGISVPEATLSLFEPPAPPAQGGAAPGPTSEEGPDEPPEAPPPAKRKGKKKKKKSKSKPLVVKSGPLLVTHSGLSGPAALRVSAFGARHLNSAGYRAALEVNWAGEVALLEAAALEELTRCAKKRPDLASKAVATFCPLLRAESGGGGGPVSGPVGGPVSGPVGGEEGSSSAALVPRRLWAALVGGAAGLPSERRWGQLTGGELERLARALTRCRLQVVGKGAFKDEFVTCGGVRLKDVDLRSMESKHLGGLFFAGEVLDVDGVTGGFNFQSCWTTGFLAGRAIADKAAALEAA